MELLPDPALVNIAKHLEPDDLMNFSESHPRFDFLKYYLPEYLDLFGNDINKHGPYDGHFEPEHYFYSPVMLQRVKSITMTFRWKDQGFGNRKGMVWIELLRASEVIATSHEDYHFIAPHEYENKEVVITNHPVVDNIRKGDILEFKINVGGGGGHRLFLKDFKAKLELLKF